MSQPVLSLSRRLRQTPYTHKIEALGVKSYTIYNHMLLPTCFRSLEEDYHHLKRAVQLWDVSVERQVEIKGADAARLVQLMTPRNMSKAVVGQCVYAPLVDEKGGMINDPVVLKLAEDHYWLSIADSDVALWAKGLATGFGLSVAICEPDVYPLAVQGPKADDLMAEIFGEEVRSIRFFRFQWLNFQGHDIVVARSGWSKQGGFEIYLDRPEMASDLWDALWKAGQSFDVRPGSPNLIERIEGGLFSYGNDFTIENNPLECGLEGYCDLEADINYLARDALLCIREEGVQRQLRGLRFAGRGCSPCQQVWPVIRKGEKVGDVTSASWSPDLSSNIAIAMMEKSAWSPGEVVQVQTPEGLREGKVCLLPFVQ